MPDQTLIQFLDQVIIDRIGNRMIHIEGNWDDHVYPVWKGQSLYIGSHSVCCAEVSSAENYGTFSTARDLIPHPELDILWSRHPKYYDTTRCGWAIPALDLTGLKWSPKTWRRASRLLYSTNTYAFTILPHLKAWLAAVPPEMRPHIHRIHLAPLILTGHVLESSSYAFEWNTFFSEEMVAQIPKLRSLVLEINLRGFVSCWYISQASAFTEMFRPFRQLPLKSVTVVIRDYKHAWMPERYACGQREHQAEHHAIPPNESFEQRKELRRTWAEEIRAMCLGREN